MKSPLALLALCILATTSFAQEHPAVTALPNSVYVGADGKFESAPDTAVVQFNISVQDSSSQAAYDHASKKRSRSAQVLRANGIEPKPPTSDSFPFSPYTSGNQNKKSSATASPRRHIKAQGFFQDRLHHPATSRRQRERNSNSELHPRNHRRSQEQSGRRRLPPRPQLRDAIARASGRTLGELSYASSILSKISVSQAAPGPRHGCYGQSCTSPTEEFTPQAVTVTPT